MQNVGRILIIDDNPTDRFVHKKLLEIHKISDDIVEVESGKKAITFFKENNTLKVLPTIVLLDIMMPEMDGFDFLKHYEVFKKELVKEPYIFMLSSTDDEYDLQRVRKNPHVMRLLKKPFSPDAFKSLIKDLKL